MNANEFRIGNWVYQNGELTEIVSIDRGSKTLYRINDILINKVTLLSKNTNKIVFEPVPITEEWLLKFGFERIGDTTYFEKTYSIEGYDYGFTINFNINGCNQNESEYSVGIDMLYVHQLQNRYFSFTGEELVKK